MNGTRMQQLVNKGFRISAAKVGLPFNVYRYVGNGNPIVPGALVATLPAAFSIDDYRFRRPAGYAEDSWTCLIDGAVTQPGDYLVEAVALPSASVRTFFVVAQQPLLPILTVNCNATASIYRPTPQTGEGELPQGGNEAAVNVALFEGWPCSLLQGTKGEKSDTGIEGSTRSPWMTCLLPPSTLQFDIKTNDNMTDDKGREFVVSGAEATDLGWRLTVAYVGP